MSETGHAAVELALAVGVLLLPAALFVLSLGPWLEARVTAKAIAAEAARGAAIDLDLAAGVDIAKSVVSTRGVSLEGVRLGWCGAAPDEMTSPSGSCTLVRGSVVAAEVEVWVPLITTPWGPIGGFWTGAGHSEPVDLYRSIP